MRPRRLIALLDCGDTLIDEGTEIRDDDGVVISGDMIPGARQMLLDLDAAGFRLGLVADGLLSSFENLLTQHGVFDLFETVTCSEAVRHSKPSPRMFKAALGSLDLEAAETSRCVMVGNNLARDIKGANALGITSIHLAWTPRYPRVPADALEAPDRTIATPSELLPLLERLDARLQETEERTA
ncbi:HAD family hydrolase [Brachybacterium sp. YJGR34]|uniref:HAD family hydrolase n=1 Tax=Brachybacterium sp. YJGR34 TaxID=2059911 RepID=UPI000E0AE2EA|nr:HAD family hydrolase [Brachybacterium sp. YJGR34]